MRTSSTSKRPDPFDVARKRFGRLPARSSTPNLLRRAGTSPTVAEANEHPGTQHHQRGLTPLMLLSTTSQPLRNLHATIKEA